MFKKIVLTLFITLFFYWPPGTVRGQLEPMEIEKFDCGSKFHWNFPKQKKLKTHKPLLQELFNKVDLSEVMILFEIKSEKLNKNI